MQDQNLAEMTLNPSKHFKSPMEVLIHTDLSEEQKRKILESWLFDAERLAGAADESMAGGEKQPIDEVMNAILNLPSSNANQSADHTGT